MLAAAMHATGPDAVLSAMYAIQAVLRIAPQDYYRYLQLISDSIGEDAMQQVRAQLPPEDEEPLSAWERRGSSFVRGRREGLEQGLASMRATLYTVLAARGLTVDGPTEAKIAACDDFDQLRELTARAATISELSELFPPD